MPRSYSGHQRALAVATLAVSALLFVATGARRATTDARTVAHAVVAAARDEIQASTPGGSRPSSHYADLPADVSALLDDDEPLHLARAAYAAVRAYPLSFSLPSSKWRAAPTRARDGGLATVQPLKTRTWGTVIPGDEATYIFMNESSYMADYGASWYGRTWRKAGWDCMRHVEIIGAGAVPVFTNASVIPPAIMTAYPKRLLVAIERLHATADDAQRAVWREALLRWGSRQLTCGASVRGMAAAAGVPLRRGATRAAFIDSALPTGGDYAANMVLVGLVTELGDSAVDVLHPVDYMYDDADPAWVASLGLYAGGFNYARCLPARRNATSRSADAILADIAAGAYDVVVYGSVRRSSEHLRDAVLGRYPRERVWLVDGEDESEPQWWLDDAAVAANATVFKRELLLPPAR